MIMTVNICNFAISFGFFEKDIDDPISHFKISCDTKRTADEYTAIISGIAQTKRIDLSLIDGVIISSVVPRLTRELKHAVQTLTDCEALVVGPGIKTGFHIKIDTPSELGGDMVANTAAAIRQKGENKCAIVADIGDVITVSAISEKGEYLGCAIFSGIRLSLDSLRGSAAQLPTVNLVDRVRAIGRSSNEALCSGAILGAAMTLDGFVNAFCEEMHVRPLTACLIATGDDAYTVLEHSKCGFVIDEHLTHRGLKFMYFNTTKA